MTAEGAMALVQRALLLALLLSAPMLLFGLVAGLVISVTTRVGRGRTPRAGDVNGHRVPVRRTIGPEAACR